MTYPGGYVYKGDYVNHKRSGYGEESWTSGNKYVGQFRNDVRHRSGYWPFLRKQFQYVFNFPINFSLLIFLRKIKPFIPEIFNLMIKTILTESIKMSICR
jgi:hypothetical protein